MRDHDQAEAAIFFATPAAFEAWLEEHHASARELKKEETRQRRLETLIADSAAGRTIKELTPPSKWRAATKPSEENGLG